MNPVIRAIAEQITAGRVPTRVQPLVNELAVVLHFDDAEPRRIDNVAPSRDAFNDQWTHTGAFWRRVTAMTFGN